ncbi:MAG TPA: VOC family protein [Kribbellaceae bacterium]
MHPGSIVFVEIPVRRLARAADFYAGLFGWTFEVDEQADSWYFTSGGAGPMGRITTHRPAGGQGTLVYVAVDDISTTVKRAIELGGGTAGQGQVDPDVGDYAVLIDPDGTRIGVFHSVLRGHRSRPDFPGTTRRNGT